MKVYKEPPMSIEEIEKFEDDYYEYLKLIGRKLLEWFPNTSNNDEYLYVSILAKYCDTNYFEPIRGFWNPIEQESLLRDVIAALQKLQDGVHPDIRYLLEINDIKFPSAYQVEQMLELNLERIKRGISKGGNFNNRATHIVEVCVDAWEYLGKQKSQKTISETSPIAIFIQDIFDILNEPSSVRAAYRSLKGTQ